MLLLFVKDIRRKHAQNGPANPLHQGLKIYYPPALRPFETNIGLRRKSNFFLLQIIKTYLNHLCYNLSMVKIC